MAAGYCLLLLAVLAVLPEDTFQCATNGICGGGPYCGGYAPQPAPSCGCQQRGYQCGSYGCYRARARSSNTFTPRRHRTRMEQDREILLSKLQASTRRRADVVSSVESESVEEPEMTAEEHRLTKVSRTAAQIRVAAEAGERIDPNRAFMECCLDRKLPDACLAKCNYGAYNKPALTAMYFKQDPCPLAAMSEMQFCAAQGRDHRECCARNGVSTTLAGQKCLTFCDQRVGRVEQLDMSFVPCFDRFEEMKSCFWHDITRFYRA